MKRTLKTSTIETDPIRVSLLRAAVFLLISLTISYKKEKGKNETITTK